MPRQYLYIENGIKFLKKSISDQFWKLLALKSANFGKMLKNVKIKD